MRPVAPRRSFGLRVALPSGDRFPIPGQRGYRGLSPTADIRQRRLFPKAPPVLLHGLLKPSPLFGLPQLLPRPCTALVLSCTTARVLDSEPVLLLSSAHVFYMPSSFLATSRDRPCTPAVFMRFRLPSNI